MGLEGGQQIGVIGKLAEKHQIDCWKEIVEEVQVATSRWTEIAERLEVNRQVIKEYGTAIDAVPLKHSIARSHPLG